MTANPPTITNAARAPAKTPSSISHVTVIDGTVDVEIDADHIAGAPARARSLTTQAAGTSP